MSDLSKSIETSVADWVAFVVGHRVPIAPSTVANVSNRIAAMAVPAQTAVDLLPAFLTTIGKPRGVWMPFLNGCLTNGFEQFCLEHQARAVAYERAKQQAAQALADHKANTCTRCEGFGMLGARPECVADVREAIKHGAVLCDCEGGEFWREAIR